MDDFNPTYVLWQEEEQLLDDSPDASEYNLTAADQCISFPIDLFDNIEPEKG